MLQLDRPVHSINQFGFILGDRSLLLAQKREGLREFSSPAATWELQARR